MGWFFTSGSDKWMVVLVVGKVNKKSCNSGFPMIDLERSTDTRTDNQIHSIYKYDMYR